MESICRNLVFCVVDDPSNTLENGLKNFGAQCLSAEAAIKHYRAGRPDCVNFLVYDHHLAQYFANKMSSVIKQPVIVLSSKWLSLIMERGSLQAPTADDSYIPIDYAGPLLKSSDGRPLFQENWGDSIVNESAPSTMVAAVEELMAAPARGAEKSSRGNNKGTGKRCHYSSAEDDLMLRWALNHAMPFGKCAVSGNKLWEMAHAAGLLEQHTVSSLQTRFRYGTARDVFAVHSAAYFTHRILPPLAVRQLPEHASAQLLTPQLRKMNSELVVKPPETLQAPNSSENHEDLTMVQSREDVHEIFEPPCLSPIRYSPAVSERNTSEIKTYTGQKRSRSAECTPQASTDSKRSRTTPEESGDLMAFCGTQLPFDDEGVPTNDVPTSATRLRATDEVVAETYIEADEPTDSTEQSTDTRNQNDDDVHIKVDIPSPLRARNAADGVSELANKLQQLATRNGYNIQDVITVAKAIAMTKKCNFINVDGILSLGKPLATLLDLISTHKDDIVKSQHTQSAAEMERLLITRIQNSVEELE